MFRRANLKVDSVETSSGALSTGHVPFLCTVKKRGVEKEDEMRSRSRSRRRRREEEEDEERGVGRYGK